MTVETITPTTIETAPVQTPTEPKPVFAHCVLCGAEIERPKMGWLPAIIKIAGKLGREPKSTELVDFIFCGPCGKELRAQKIDTFSFSKVQHTLREEERAAAERKAWREEQREAKARAKVLKARFGELFKAKEGGNGKAN